MPKTIRVSETGKTITLPDDFTPEQVQQAVDDELRQAGGRDALVNLQAQQQAASPPPSGFFGKMTAAALPSTNLKDYYQGPAYAAQHPLDSLRLIAGGLLDAHRQQFKRAIDAYREGRYGDIIPNALLAATPMVGPQIGSGVEDIRKGDVAGGLGTLAGTALPLLAGKAISKVAPAGLKIAGVDVPQSVAEAGAGPITRATEAVVSRLPFGRVPYKGLRLAQQQKLVDGANALADQISSFRGSGEDLGRQIDQTVTAAKNTLENDTKVLYANVDAETASQPGRVPVQTTVPTSLVDERGNPLTYDKTVLQKVDVGGIQPETKVLKPFAIQLLRRLNNEEKLIDPAELSPIRSQLETIINAPKRLPFQAFADAKSSLYAIARRYDQNIPGKREGISNELATLADQAMEQAVKKAGRYDLLEDLQTASANWRYLKESFNDSVAGKLIDNKQPEAAYRLLVSPTTSLDELRNVKALMGGKFDAVGRQAVLDILQKALREDGQGNQSLNPRGFNNALNQLRNSGKLAELLEPDLVAQLQNIGNLSQKFRISTAQWLEPLLLTGMGEMALRGGLHLIGGSIPAEAVAAGGLYGMAKILTNPGNAATVARYIRATKLGDVAKANAIATNLAGAQKMEAMRAEARARAIASSPDIAKLYGQPQQAAPQNPVTVNIPQDQQSVDKFKQEQ